MVIPAKTEGTRCIPQARRLNEAQGFLVVECHICGPRDGDDCQKRSRADTDAASCDGEGAVLL